MTKRTKLINESVIRRWGKLANMQPLTENFLENTDEESIEEGEHDDMMDAAEDEVAAGEAEMEAGEAAEADEGERDAVEAIVNAVVDAISAETGVDIEVEGDADEAAMDDMDAGMDAADELDDDADDDMDAAMRDPAMRDPAMRDKDVAMRDPASRDDDEDLEERQKYGGNKGDIPDADRKKKGHHGKGQKRKETAKEEGEVDESLELEIIDDEALTEAVLARVVERLLSKN